MKKTSIIFIFCTLLFVTACSTSENQTQATEATGTIEQVETDAILINNFKEKKDKYNPEAAIRFDIVDKYYDETGNKIKITDLNKNDDVKIILTNDFPIRETNPAQIDPKYVQKNHPAKQIKLSRPQRVFSFLKKINSNPLPWCELQGL